MTLQCVSPFPCGGIAVGGHIQRVDADFAAVGILGELHAVGAGIIDTVGLASLVTHGEGGTALECRRQRGIGQQVQGQAVIPLVGADGMRPSAKGVVIV